MANRKISDLTALTAPATGDLLPIVDISEAAAADKNKKITYGELLASAPAGSAAAPSFSFDSDPDSGLYSAGANQVAISTNGVARLTSSTTALTSALAVDVPLGAAATPSLTFTGDLNTGIYSPGADQVAISTGGTGRLFIGANPHVGIGVTPNASSASSQVLEVGPSTFSSIGNDSYQGSNWFYTGAAYVYKNSAAATQYVQASGNHIWLTAASGTAGNAVTFSEQLRITSAGLVGIGTSAPGTKLEVFNTGTYGTAFQPSIYITNASSGGTVSANTGLGAITWATDSNANLVSSIEAIRENPATGSASALVLRTGSSGGGVERLRITSSGAVGIGTTSPSTALQVVGTARFGDGTNGTVSLTSNSSSSFYDSLNNAATGWQTAVFRATTLTFSTDASSTPTERGRFDSSGRLLVGTSTAPTSSSGDAVLGLGVGGIAVSKQGISTANNGTVDIQLIDQGQRPYAGFLAVSNSLSANRASRTQTTFSVFGDGTTSSAQQISTASFGSAMSFTVTTPSDGVIRVTNTSGSTCDVTMVFYGCVTR